jgi:kanosamine 6-kinase
VYVGIDVGGTTVGVCVEDGATIVEEVFSWPLSSTAEHDLNLLGGWVEPHLVAAGRAAGRAPAAIGIAMPATCDSAGVVVAWPGRPSWVGLDLVATLRGIFGTVPVAWADDGDLAALAEADHAGCPNVLYIGIGTGVGGGLVHEGRLWPGPRRGSFELGHLVVDMAGPRCDCGRRGCLQAIASGPATLRLAAELCGRPVTADRLARGVALDEPWASAAVARSAAAVAAAVVGVAELAHPDLVLIGGGFGLKVMDMVACVAREAEALRRGGTQPLTVRPAALDTRSSLIGALHLARRTVGDRR